ncbi:hypothetical protein [Phocaeicola paurosaccharolyticus]|uniref:hypothetical protein n=1 Tax=Phocaeicola paurosaccharolyticus TaxID=732242 RepID=UPI002FDF4E81
MAEITKAYIEARRAAIKWLNGKREYNEGVLILQQSGYKPIVVSKLMRHGEKPHTKEKLEYEIRQMIQVWYNPSNPRFEDCDIDDDEPADDETENDNNDNDGNNDVNEETATEIIAAAENEEKKEADENHYPEAVAKIIYDFRDCYNTRSKLHRQLFELGELNTPEVIASRKEIATSIRALSTRMSKLSDLKKRFDTNAMVPTDEEMDDLYAEPKEEKKEDDDEPADEKKADIESLSLEDLKKRKANIKSNICKANNMLMYSSSTKPKDGKENPLPECPSKVKYTNKVTTLTSELEKIDYRIAELS